MRNLEEIYKEKLGCFDAADVKSLGWSSIETQMMRFKILTEIGMAANHTILDVGCGYGDFYDYTMVQAPKSLNALFYSGIDIRESAIVTARSKHYAAIYKAFNVGSIYDMKESSFDWVVGSGIFCFDDKEWFYDTINTIQKMLDVCNYGVAVNFLSDLTPFKKLPDMKYTSLQELRDIITSLSPHNKFIIRHDYAPNDVTVYLYKSQK